MKSYSAKQTVCVLIRVTQHRTSISAVITRQVCVIAILLWQHPYICALLIAVQPQSNLNSRETA